MVTLLIRNLAIELKEILEKFYVTKYFISKQTIIKAQDLTEKLGKENFKKFRISFMMLVKIKVEISVSNTWKTGSKE